MRVKTWRIIDRGRVPMDAPTIPWTCACGREATLPVLGRVEAVVGGNASLKGDEAAIFDPAEEWAMPVTIQCRKCGRVYTTAMEARVR